jgi:hypothetical protein
VLRQLARLTRPLPAAGPDALGVTIYDHPDGAVIARESGLEGVTCVDDASRLLAVLCDVWEPTRLSWIERWARGLLEFVLWMQQPDGTWVNFITDWDGEKNLHGITSRSGQNFWHARALASVGRASMAFEDERARAAYRLGMSRATSEEAPPDIRALHLDALLRGPDADLDLARRWANEIVSCADGKVLKNSPFELGEPHLWAHIQEGVLASASTMLDEPALLEVAIASAERIVLPPIERGFAGPATIPYDVSSCVAVCDALAAATGAARWASAAADARRWFDLRDPSGVAVYDRDTGCVADGVDDGRVSVNSGAEANICAAEALLDDAVAVAQQMTDPFTG